MIKKIIVLITFTFSFAFLSGESSAKNTKIRAGVLNGPSAIPCAYLIENKADCGLDLSFQNHASAQTELVALLKGELDVGFLPPNAAAKVFNSANRAIVCLGISGNGNLFLISKKENLPAQNNEFEQINLEFLRGKTVYCAGQGATPEYMFLYLLSKEKIPANSTNGVTLDFSIPNANIALALVSGKIEYALVPEPFATVAQEKDKNVVRAVNIQKLYKNETNNHYPITLLVANSTFAKENKEILKTFVQFYAKANDWTAKNPEEAGILTQKNQLGLKAEVAQKAIANAGFTWKNSSSAKKEIESLLCVFLKNAPESVGGKLPSDDFYFEP